MESFELNTAAAFLPVMDNTENVTKQLISSILMYNSLLDEKSKPILLNFILTTRLSDSAKLRLSKQYNTVEQLVDDMNQQLLTKKSFTSIQQQLLNCTQNEKTIDDYGKEIEELFVQLTITQADGDSNKRQILHPLNEKTAIHRFATGLKDKNLSVIIAARTYHSLKNAIRDANDEHAVMTSTRTESTDNKQFSHNNISGPTWVPVPGVSYNNQRGHGPPHRGRGFVHGGHNSSGFSSQRGLGYLGRGGFSQPSNRGHSQPTYYSHDQQSQRGRGDSSNREHGQSSNHSHSQPSQRGHGQPSQYGHGQPSQRGHGQPSQRGHGQPNQRGHGQPNQRGHGQPNQRGHGQPNERGHGQHSRGNHHQNQGNHDKNFNNYKGGNNSGKNNPTPETKIETHVHVVTTTITSNVKKDGPKHNTHQKPSGPKNNPTKTKGPDSKPHKNTASNNKNNNK